MRRAAAWTSFLLAACGLAALGHRFQLTIVVGDSMRPTWKTGDVALVDRRAYDAEAPRENDVVMARVSGGHVLKRIVGIPGQTVEVRSGMVYLDGLARPPSFPTVPGDLDILPGVLATGRYALLGDNRAVVGFSTSHALVTQTEIVGKVIGWIRLWPDSSPPGSSLGPSPAPEDREPSPAAHSVSVP